MRLSFIAIFAISATLTANQIDYSKIYLKKEVYDKIQVAGGTRTLFEQANSSNNNVKSMGVILSGAANENGEFQPDKWDGRIFSRIQGDVSPSDTEEEPVVYDDFCDYWNTILSPHCTTNLGTTLDCTVILPSNINMLSCTNLPSPPDPDWMDDTTINTVTIDNSPSITVIPPFLTQIPVTDLTITDSGLTTIPDALSGWAITDLNVSGNAIGNLDVTHPICSVVYNSFDDSSNPSNCPNVGDEHNNLVGFYNARCNNGADIDWTWLEAYTGTWYCVSVEENDLNGINFGDLKFYHASNMKGMYLNTMTALNAGDLDTLSQKEFRVVTSPTDISNLVSMGFSDVNLYRMTGNTALPLDIAGNSVGDIYIEESDFNAINMNSVQTVNDITLNKLNNLSSLSFNSLQTANDIKIEYGTIGSDTPFDFDLPVLTTANDILFNYSERVATFEAQSLQNLKNIGVSYTKKLQTISLPNLTNMTGSIDIKYNSNELESFSAPELINVDGGITFYRNYNKLTNINLSKLQTANQYLLIRDNRKIVNAETPALTTVGSITILDNTILENIDISKVSSASSLTISGNSKISSNINPKMTTMSGNLKIFNSPLVQNIDFSNLESTNGYVNISSSGTNSILFPKLKYSSYIQISPASNIDIDLPSYTHTTSGSFTMSNCNNVNAPVLKDVNGYVNMNCSGNMNAPILETTKGIQVTNGGYLDAPNVRTTNGANIDIVGGKLSNLPVFSENVSRLRIMSNSQTEFISPLSTDMIEISGSENLSKLDVTLKNGGIIKINYNTSGSGTRIPLSTFDFIKPTTNSLNEVYIKNATITNLDDFLGVTEITSGKIYLSYNAYLTDVTGLQNITTPNGTLTFTGAAVPSKLPGASEICQSWSFVNIAKADFCQ